MRTGNEGPGGCVPWEKFQNMEWRATRAEHWLWQIEQVISPRRADQDFGDVLDRVDALVFEARRVYEPPV